MTRRPPSSSSSPSLPSSHIQLGSLAESRAALYLERLGYQILDRNYRTKHGEVDLVALHDGVLCFVEVRCRSSRSHGLPEETISRAKRRRIVRAAQHYLVARHQEQAECRFDVVAVELLEKGAAASPRRPDDPRAARTEDCAADGCFGMRLLRDAFRLNDC
ncbi:MAG: YraN family protein [Pseudomonadota bacterium]